MNNQNESVSVVMVRHAQSQWNKENRFTGWADPSLTQKGLEEARQAAECLRANGYYFDMAYSSRLQRAIKTGELILARLVQDDILYVQDWRLNERHYGKLQGVNKDDAAGWLRGRRAGLALATGL